MAGYKTRSPHRLWLPAALLLTALFLCTLSSGCGRYQLGQPGGTRQVTIYVDHFVNETSVPGLEVALNREIRKQIADLPQFRLTTRVAESDYVLSGQVTHYERSLGARRADDTARARSLIVEVDANFNLVDSKTGIEVVQGRSIRESGAIYDTFNFMEAERQKIPLLGRDLATAIKNQIVVFLTQQPEPEYELTP